MWDLFFAGWKPLLHTLVIGALSYPLMLVMLRISGHRTLSKMNAFDLVVTVALGSTLASAITSSDVSLAQGLLAFALLISMQVIVAWLAKRSSRMEWLFTGEPVLLYHDQKFLWGAMRRARITKEELCAGMREEGASSLDQVNAIVLETNGKLSVTRQREAAGPPAPPITDNTSTVQGLNPTEARSATTSNR
jgi:uncharacterized membrane protein YcaP (DUF421 family)